MEEKEREDENEREKENLVSPFNEKWNVQLPDRKQQILVETLPWKIFDLYANTLFTENTAVYQFFCYQGRKIKDARKEERGQKKEREKEN